MGRGFSAVFVFLLAVSFGTPSSIQAGRTLAAAPTPVAVAQAPINEPLDGAGVPVPTPTAFAVAQTVAPPADPVRAGLRIEVPSLGIDLPLVEGNGLEPELYVADHYPGMKWPGQGGRSFIYAHARPGMFGPLLGARPVGAEVDVTQPGGAVLRYVITSYTASWNVNDTSILAPANHEELVLYTCTSWNYTDPKIVAIAVPKG